MSGVEKKENSRKTATPDGPIHYHGAIIRRNGPAWRAEINHGGKRTRRQSARLDRLKVWVDSVLHDVLSGNAPLSPEQCVEYRTAMDRLPEGVSLLEAVTGYISANRAAPNIDDPLESAVEVYIAEKKASGLRSRTIHTISWTLGRLVAAAGGTPCGRISPSMLFDILTGLGPATRETMRVRWRTFFSWAINAGYCASNPALAVTRVRMDEKRPDIFTTDETAAIMEAAEKTDKGSMAAYLALGFFAGIRTAGIMAIRWQDIGDTIHVTPEADKLRSSRYVDIRENLAAWLEKYRRAKGRVCPYGQKKAYATVRKICKAAKVEWKHNAMRHSFASYLLADVEDSGKVAMQLGHRSPDMLYRHYRALVGKGDAKAYFSVFPGGSRGHVLDIKDGQNCTKLHKTAHFKKGKIRPEKAKRCQ